MTPDQIFRFRPLIGWSGYRAPNTPGLYLCASTAHPGGGVMGGSRPQRGPGRAGGPSVRRTSAPAGGGRIMKERMATPRRTHAPDRSSAERDGPAPRKEPERVVRLSL